MIKDAWVENNYFFIIVNTDIGYNNVLIISLDSPTPYYFNTWFWWTYLNIVLFQAYTLRQSLLFMDLKGDPVSLN